MTGQMKQYLTDAVTGHAQATGKGDIQFRGQQHTLLADARCQQLHYAIQQALRLELDRLQLNRAGLDTSEVEHVVQQVSECRRRLASDSHQPLLLTVQRHLAKQLE